jgi:RimJ/RimL family protein N-acetyltransferase
MDNEIKLVEMSAERAEMKWVKKLFVSAFPRNERPPFFIMRWRMKKARWLKIVANGENAGFFYLVENDSRAYLFFFAVEERLRGKRIGTEALKILTDEWKGKCLYLAIEPPDENVANYAERVSRKEFYKRCGFLETGQFLREGNMIYEVLGNGGEVTDPEHKKLMKKWLGLPLIGFFEIR